MTFPKPHFEQRNCATFHNRDVTVFSQPLRRNGYKRSGFHPTGRNTGTFDGMCSDLSPDLTKFHNQYYI